MNEENLRKLYERLGISEAPAASPPPPLPTPAAVAEPPPPPAAAHPGPGAIPSALDRLTRTRVTLSLPMLAASLGAIAIGLFLVSRSGSPPPAPPPAPVAVAPAPAPAPPVIPDPPAPSPDPIPPAVPDPIPAAPPPPDPPPAPPPPPVLTPEERRAARIRENGGTDASEAAVDLALDWLARHQAETGEWEAMHFERRCPRTSSCQVKDAAGDPLYTPGVTGLALLAFLGAGHTPTTGPFAKTISLGLAWLVERQDADGGIKHDRRVLFYNQAVAARALCEAAAVTGDDRFRVAGQKAIDYLAATQGADGGWTYFREPGDLERNDASIAGWVAFALRAAEAAKLTIPPEMKGRVLSLFSRRTVESTGEVIYSDREPGAGRRGAGLLALGLLVRGWAAADPELERRAAARLLVARPDWEQFAASQERSSLREYPFSPDQNMAGWYYGTEAMFHRGGDDWIEWNRALRDPLVGRQIKAGHAAGSWMPELSYIGREGGRVFATAVSALMLTIYARPR